MNTIKARVAFMVEAPESDMMREALEELRHGEWRLQEVAGDDAGPFRVTLRQVRAYDLTVADQDRVYTTERWE